MAVVAAGELDDHVPAGEPAGQADGAHRRLGAGADHPHHLDRRYGVNDQFLGVPVKLGKGGAEQVIEIELTADEKTALMKSAAAVKELTTVIGV